MRQINRESVLVLFGARIIGKKLKTHIPSSKHNIQMTTVYELKQQNTT